jgi:N utilization substance protein A
LKRLFEEEIHEVYDGTVLIKAIAREAGVRSKVAVTSNNEDIDATGACIGPAGTRIQKIVAQLGNGKDKEKIDVINYSTNPACFIIEALRPATVIGVNLTDPDAEPNPRATAIIKDGQKSIAIGRKAANARLASKITGWSIDIKEESEAADLGLEYKSSEEWIRESDLEKRALEKEAFLAKTRAAKAEAEEKKQEEIVLEPTPKPAPKAAVSEEDFPEEAINPAAAALAEAQRQDALKAEEEAKEAARKAEEEEKAKAPVEPTFVRTTTTLSSLEAELESAKEKKSKPVSKKRPRKITEDEVKNVATPSAENAPQPAVNAMPIYTKEEMDEIAKEEEEANDNSFYDDDIDYEEYDQYYDDDEGGRR